MNTTTTKSIKAFTALVTFLAILITQNLSAQIQSAGSGDWHMGSTWVGGNVPSSSDEVDIVSGHTITMSAPVNIDMPGSLDVSGTLELTQAFGGSATKNILSSGVLNVAGGSLAGGEWIIANGGIINVNASTGVGSSVTLRNHGTFNWLSGHINEMGPYSCYYGAPPPCYFINETDGIWNINISSDFHLGAVWVTNHGVMNKTGPSTLEFHSGCAGSTLNNTSTGTLNVLAGQITFNSGNTVLNGVIDLDGTLLVNTIANIGAAISLDGTLTLSSTSDFSSAVTLAGSGTLNVTYSLSIPDNFVFTIPTINLSGSITGAGIKTYASGVNVNLNGGGLAGLEHVIQSGAVVNINSGSFGSSTTIRNQGTINWDSGFVNEMGPFSCYYGAPPPAILLNEASGTVNLNQPVASHLGATHTTNNGVFNKTTSSMFTFHSGCSGSPFTNAASGEMNGIGTMQFDYGFTNLGTIAPGLSPGELTLNFATVTNSVLDIQLASAAGPGTGHDRLNVNGNYTASGTLNVTLDMGYTASGSPTFEIVSTTGSVSGMFSTINYPPGNWYIDYNANSILIGKISLTPGCTGLVFPSNGATSVSPDAILSWAPVMDADGYSLFIGTSPGGTDLANNLDVGNVTSYDHPGPLPFGSTIYVTISPYNEDGPAAGCSEQSFSVAQQCPIGNVTLLNQTQVDAYVSTYPYCTTISGNFQIGPSSGSSNITDLSGLVNLTNVTGTFRVRNNGVLTSLNGLDGLTTVGGSLVNIWFNSVLTNLQGLNGLQTITGNLDIFQNPLLTSINLDNLTSIGGYLWFDTNISLTSLSGMGSLVSVGTYFYISGNTSLTSVTGLGLLSTVGTNFQVWNNAALTGFNGLSSLGSVGGYFNVYNNGALVNLSGLSSLGAVGGYFRIFNNASMTSLSGVENLTTIPGYVFIEDNPMLLNLSGLDGLTSIGSYLHIKENIALISLTGLGELESIGGTFVLHSNPSFISPLDMGSLITIGGDFDIWFNNAMTSFAGMESLSSIAGYLHLNNNAAITSFSGLSSLASVGGFLQVWYNGSLINMTGLNALTSVGGYVYIQSNAVMSNLNGLNALTSIGGYLQVWYSPALISLSGLNSLTTVGGFVNIYVNDVLTSLNGLESLTTIGDYFQVAFCPQLTSTTGMNNLVSVAGFVNFYSNSALGTLNGLNSLTSIGGYFQVAYCASLTEISGLNTLSNIGGYFNIYSSDVLTSLSGLQSLTTIEDYFQVAFCPTLPSLNGINALTSVGNWLSIQSNVGLTSIQALSSLAAINGQLTVSWNPSLTSLSGLENVNPLSITHLEMVNSGQLSICGLPNICEYVSNPANSANISGNAAGCATRPDLEYNCTDDDNDGYGIALDCNDNNATQFPGATEICNNEDDDCDGMVDEGLADDDEDGVCDLIDNCVIHYNPAQEDGDMDGVGDECDNCPNHSNPGQEDNEGDGIGDVCDPNDDNDPSNDANDCAPFNALIYPGATEVCGDLVDNNCNGLVDEPLGMVVLAEQDIFCNGQPTGLISVEGACGLPPYSYTWNNGASTPTISNLSIGTYKVTITDAQGLTKQQTFYITQPTMLTVATSRRNVSCNGSADGSATANPNGGVSPYTYIWSNGATTKTADNLVAGTYTVTVTDNNLCTKTATVTITQPTPVEITSIDVAPDPGNPGKFIITVYAQGGTPYNDGYRYRRCNPNGTGCAAWRVSNVFTNMPAGSHLMKVKDKIGCTDQQLVTIENPPALQVEPDAFATNEANDLPIGQMEVESTYVFKPLEVIGMTLLPNPGREFVMVRWDATEAGYVQITMHDPSGKLMHQEKVEQASGINEYYHATPDIKSGMYIITLKTPQTTQSNYWIKAN